MSEDRNPGVTDADAPHVPAGSDVDPGSWIGQQADQNTHDVREQLPEDAERVAVTNNESEDSR